MDAKFIFNIKQACKNRDVKFVKNIDGSVELDDKKFWTMRETEDYLESKPRKDL